MKTKSETEMRSEGYLRIAELLPRYIKNAIDKTLAEHSLPLGELTDIRLRRGGISSVTVGGRSYPLGIILSARKADELIFALCEESVYAHTDTIREGYINCRGIRVGVCGRAVTENGRTVAVTECSSAVIRIPHEIMGCADGIYAVWKRTGRRGLLIYSPPGVGKTTVLCDLMRLLSHDGHQFAVIDTRGELSGAAENKSADVLIGYPKHEGIRSAVRSLSPELILCDELAGEADAEAALYALSSGVPLIATTHAGSRDELSLRPDLIGLFGRRAFGATVGLARTGTVGRFALDTDEAP